MKSYKEWKEENFNEFFGFGKKSPVQHQQNDQQPNKQRKAFCPFCRQQSAILVDDMGAYPQYVQYWRCEKCAKEWHREDAEIPDANDKGYGLILLPQDKVINRNNRKLENKLYNLYLAGVVSEDAYLENLDQQNAQQQQPADINQIATQMQFLPTSKKKLVYQFAQDINNMQPMTYGVAQQQMPVVTMTSDGKETQNTAEPNDIIMSGPSGEKYVIKSAKFPKLYVGQIGGPVHPEQGPRNVAVYTGQVPVNFTASWGESMVLKPGDYLVKEAEGKYYRIAKKEYEMTYNPPGKIG